MMLLLLPMPFVCDACSGSGWIESWCPHEGSGHGHDDVGLYLVVPGCLVFKTLAN